MELFELLKQVTERGNEAGQIFEKYNIEPEDRIKLIELLTDKN